MLSKRALSGPSMRRRIRGSDSLTLALTHLSGALIPFLSDFDFVWKAGRLSRAASQPKHQVAAALHHDNDRESVTPYPPVR